jgi:hypothetical protein
VNISFFPFHFFYFSFKFNNYINKDEQDERKPVKDSWEDEDDLDDVKDDWDQEDETPVKEVKPTAATKKSTTTSSNTTNNKELREMTEEEKKEAQINADLDHTKELFGISKSLDEFSLNSKEDYQDYINRLYGKINLQNVYDYFYLH